MRAILFRAVTVLVLVGFIPLEAREQKDGQPNWQRSVVRVEVTRKQYDYLLPWTSSMQTANKSGLVVAPNEILTTADGLADQTLVRLQKNGRGKWFMGEVRWIDYHANLASLTTQDAGFWNGLQPAELASPISTTDSLHILRWRGGNLESRKAEFTRYSVEPSRLSFLEYMQMECTAEITGAGAAEPLLAGQQVVGLITLQTGNTCRAVPSSFIRGVLEARKLSYKGLGYFDFVWQQAENPATLKFLKLDGEPRGVIIIETPDGELNKGKLKERDIVVQVAGFDIDIQGDYEDPDYGHLSLENLATRGRWAGEEVKLKIWRGGEEQEINYRLPKADYSTKLVPDAVFDQEPEYLVLGGLVFQPLSNTLLRSWGEDWKRRAPFRLTYYNQEKATKDHSALVILSQVLPDVYNVGYQDSRFLVLDQVNGQKVSKLSDLQQALEKPTDGFHFLDFVQGDSLRRMVLDAKEKEVATARVLERYGIAKDHVFTASTRSSTLDLAADEKK